MTSFALRTGLGFLAGLVLGGAIHYINQGALAMRIDLSNLTIDL